MPDATRARSDGTTPAVNITSPQISGEADGQAARVSGRSSGTSESTGTWPEFVLESARSWRAGEGDPRWRTSLPCVASVGAQRLFVMRGILYSRVNSARTHAMDAMAFAKGSDQPKPNGMMSVDKSIVKTICAIVSVAACAVRSVTASEPEISYRSPDKKYALWQQYENKQPYLGDVKLINSKTREPVLTLGERVEPFSKKLLWSKDSQRFAYFNDASQSYGGFTRIFFRNGTSFEEVKLPDLPAPPLPQTARDTKDSGTRSRVEPLRWTKSGELVIENELINQHWGRTALEITLAFDLQHQASVTKAVLEPPSIVDYFLLLPHDSVEGEAVEWFHVMRANGNPIDRENGYMSCPGDGAQPEFEVALFRYRDGRPLLALCNGELEGDDSVFLRFFELGSNGKMQPVDHQLLPIPDRQYNPEAANKADWQFNLPRAGKTIIIRSNNAGRKILYKLTWNGERFEKSK